MLIEELTASRHAEWDEYIDAHPDATSHHLRAFQEVARAVYRLRAPLLVARRGATGTICGVLPLVVVHNWLGGYAHTGLYGSYGRILADDQEAGHQLLAEARRIAAAAQVSYLMLKSLDEEPLASGFERRDPCVIARLPLVGDEQALWRGLRDKQRNLIRKARRFNLELRSGGGEVAVFNDILNENLHHKGVPCYGLPVMRTLLRELGERAEVLTLWSPSEAVAGALLIYFKRSVYVAFASSRPSSLHMSPNNLLYWEIIRRGCARGLTLLDFGRSARGSGQLAFKLGWGAHTIPQPFYVLALRGRSPRLDPNQAGVRWLMRLWRRLPRPLADAAGPAVYRRFLG